MVHHPIIPGGAPSQLLACQWICSSTNIQVMNISTSSSGTVPPKGSIFLTCFSYEYVEWTSHICSSTIVLWENSHFYEPITSKGTPPIKQLGTLSSSPTPDLDDATVAHRFKLFNVQLLKGNIHSSRNNINSDQLSRIGISSSKHTWKIMEHTELKKHI